MIRLVVTVFLLLGEWNTLEGVLLQWYTWLHGIHMTDRSQG